MKSVSEGVMEGKIRKLYIVLASVSGAIGILLLATVIAILVPLSHESTLTNEASDTMYRAAVLTGNEDSLPRWKTEVEQGHVRVSDYVRTVLTGHDYLLTSKDDNAFAADLACIAYNDSEKISEIRNILADGSRRYAVEKILTDVNGSYAPKDGFSDEKGTRFAGISVTDPLQNEEGYAFGIRKINGTMTIEGSELRADFFVDGHPRPGQIYVPQTSGDVDFSMEWDTHGEPSGNHDVVVLIRTSDGRGQVATGGHIFIPSCYTLVTGAVQAGSIEQETKESWYALDAKDGNAYVNVVEMSADVAVDLYDRYGNPVGSNDLRNSQYEVLRGVKQNSDPTRTEKDENIRENEFFVRVKRSELATPSAARVTYTMVQSKEVAINKEGEYLAVLDDVGVVPTPRPTGAVAPEADEVIVKCRNLNMNVVDCRRGDLMFLPINGYLTELSFQDKQGKDMEIYPKFSPDCFDYAIVGKSFSEIGLTCVAQEGYAAELTVSNDVGSMLPKFTGADEKIQIQSGKNEIQLEVSNIDGISRKYKLHLLDGQDKEGFSKKTLKDFPESYANGLWLLHCLHPRYQFQAFQTGMKFEDVLNEEDNKDRSLASSAYNPTWVKPNSPVYDGKTWKGAKREVVSYFLDPRNSLTPTGIFQFEKLSFDTSIHNVEGISAMTKNSFLNQDEDKGKFTGILLKAGQKANVSPYFLASRILQEMGRNGESKLAHGTLSGYEGYFNFYNIGSTPDPNVKDGALINGAKFAKYGSNAKEKKISKEEEDLLLPWTDEEKAICGGAIWIAKSYIQRSQDTLYFQKFDLIDNEDGLYKHQYAQNISMASTEGVRYYTAYASQDMLDESFVFVVPVFDEMPNDYGTLP